MKALIMIVATAILSLSPVLAVANCTTSTFIQDGKMVICQTCCSMGNCTTTCF